MGKSTLIEIIHFCLGAKSSEALKTHELNNWTFTLDLDLAGKRYSVSRNPSNPKIIIIEGDCQGWETKPIIDESTGNQVIFRKDWNKCLGALIFGLRPSYDELKYVPTFRSLISYFIRRNSTSGGFLNPFQQYKQQLEWDIQVNNAFLLGLGWENASKLQIIKDRVKILNQIKQEAQSGLLANLMGRIGDLEALRIRLDAQVRQEDEQLKKFKVHPQYAELERNANNLTNMIHELVNQNVSEERLLALYEDSLEEEVDAKLETITKVYEDAGFVFPKSVTKKIDDVLAFHKQVVINRRDFLKNEIERLRREIDLRKQRIEDLSSKRADLMQTLEKHGALEEFTKLQDNHQINVSKLKDVSLKLETLRKFEEGKSAIAVEQELIQRQAKTDLLERGAQREKAILTFNEYS
ncbi:MAG: hypothetical protein OEW87_12290, partial [Flavobacteriaceae bacterium]|nr:hypothetical protein [Flavobacteriaceae bacterium]